MAGHLKILSQLFRDKGIKQSDVAQKMGYNSPSAISMILAGKRGIGRKELLQMCEIAGVSLTQLAGLSDDLHLTETAEALQGATLIDAMPESMRQDVLDILKGMAAKAKHAQ